MEHFSRLTRTHDHVCPLTRSYRVPRATQDLATRLVARIQGRRPRTWTATDERGVVERVNRLEDVDLTAGGWLILVRNNYLVRQVVEHLRQVGYVYRTPHDDVRDEVGVRAALAWERLRGGQELSREERHYVDQFLRQKLPSNLANLGPRRTLPWYEALDLPTEAREYYKACRRRGESLVQPPRITVSTIHGAKGGEADHVALLLDMSARTFEEYQRRPDDEARVFYVAVTRARRRLVLVEPTTPYHFNLEV